MFARMKTPVWMLLLVVVLMLPVFQFPMLLNTCPDNPPTIRTMLWIYPFYVFVSGYLAYVCYPQRPWMTWILLILMVMSHIAIWMLVTMPV